MENTTFNPIEETLESVLDSFLDFDEVDSDEFFGDVLDTVKTLIY